MSENNTLSPSCSSGRQKSEFSSLCQNQGADKALLSLEAWGESVSLPASLPASEFARSGKLWTSVFLFACKKVKLIAFPALTSFHVWVSSVQRERQIVLEKFRALR